MTYIDVDKADWLCLHERQADAVFMQGKALINDNQAKTLSKAVHGYLMCSNIHCVCLFMASPYTYTLGCVFTSAMCVCVRVCISVSACLL